jgi:hypothetical protein
LILAFRIIKDI